MSNTHAASELARRAATEAESALIHDAARRSAPVRESREISRVVDTGAVIR